MPLQKTAAITLRTAELGEADKIVVFYSLKFGKIRTVAKYARRARNPFGSSIELLSYSDLLFFEKRGGALHRITQCELIDAFPALHQDLNPLTAGIYLLDLVATLTNDGEKNPPLFYLLLRCLKLLAAGSEPGVILRIFEIRLLQLSGYQPQLDSCITCNRLPAAKETLYFSPRAGGIVCAICAKKMASKQLLGISRGSINFLKQALRMKLNQLNRLALSSRSRGELKEMLHCYLNLCAEREIKSYRFLDCF